MSVSVKSMLQERTDVAIHLMVIFTIDVFECVITWFFFQSFEFRRVSFKISFTAPCHISIVFQFVWSITFWTLRPIYVTDKCCVLPFLAIFALWNSGIYVCILNHGDVISNIEASVDEHFCIWSVLGIPYIDLNDCHIRF